LAGAGVPDANGEESGEDAGEGEAFMGGGEEDLEFLGVRVDEIGQSMKSAEGLEREDRHEQPADSQDDDLHKIGPCSGAQTSVERVSPSDEGEEKDAGDDLLV